jgi:uncharacterized protein
MIHLTSIIEPTYTKKMHCPLCELSFSSTKIRNSRIRTSKRDADFCTHFVDEANSPYLYYVFVCPHCGYAFSSQFSEKFSEQAIHTIYETISAKWRRKNYSKKRTYKDAIEAYKLAIYCGVTKKEKHYALAGLYIRLAWLYRKILDEQNELRFLRLALQEYESSYMSCDFAHSKMSEILILYMVGELHRRLGNIHDAIRAFSKVVSHPFKQLEPMLVEKAREQWQAARQQQKQQANAI